MLGNPKGQREPSRQGQCVKQQIQALEGSGVGTDRGSGSLRRLIYESSRTAWK